MAIPTFPDYRIDPVDCYGDQGYQIVSNVRLKHEGKWYLVHHRTIAASKEEAYRMFIDQTYKSVMFYKIDPEAHYSGFLDDELINKLDKDQRDEFTRLFPFKKPDTE